MGVDVTCEIEIARPRAGVAEYACDPDNAMAWYANIKSVEWETAGPLAIGSRIAFVAAFMGGPLTYTYEVRELVPGERFVMSTDDGPFEMQTTYEWSDAGAGRTRMTLRNNGEPSSALRAGARLMAAAMRRANRKDLARLKQILEA